MARYIGDTGEGTTAGPRKSKKKKRGYGQASEGRTRKAKGAGIAGIHDPRHKLTKAQKLYWGSLQRDAMPSNPNIGLEPDRNVRKKRPGGMATGGRVRKSSGGSVASRLSKAGPVAKPN